MADTSKQTIYIDVDDEITSIVEKVRDADNKILALVLPKRMATLQSIVNMKLLKRTADDAGKKIVLITSEASLLPLAGAVKIHVAKTLQSKPAIPAPPEVSKAKEIVTKDSGEKASSKDADSDDIDKNKSVGELAGMTAVAAAKDDVDEDTIDVDSIDDEPAPKDKGKEKKSKLKVPNFDKFRMRLFIAAGVLILLIIGFIFANKVLPKASINIQTNSVDINATITMTANTDQKTLDVANGLVPATSQDATETSTQQITASGQKNVGDSATGSVTMTACINNFSFPKVVPAGTTITNGVESYVTQDDTDFSHSGTPNGNCIVYQAKKSTNVTAAQSGSKYNLNAGSQFTVSGYSGYSATADSAFTGGTDKTVTVITQADINGAEQKASQDTGQAKTDLSAKLKSLNLFALGPTLQPGKQSINSSVKVGDQATSVSVTVTTDFTMLGVKPDDLQKLIDNFAKGQIDTSKQKISDYGLDQATVTISSTKSPTDQTMSFQTNATAGASIDINALKQQVVGKKSGDVQQLISNMPSVQNVTVNYSPFWVTKAPSNLNKITITVQKQQSSNNGN